MLNTISQDQRERALFHSRKMAMQDAEHNRAVVLKEGIAIGQEQGISRGVDNTLSFLEKIGATAEILNKVREEAKRKDSPLYRQ